MGREALAVWLVVTDVDAPRPIGERLKDKVAIVTGASSGIGWATSYLFALEGARVVVGARRRERLDVLVAEIQAIGGEAIGVPGDVCDFDYAEKLVATAVDAFGGLDIAFNNAAVLGPSVSAEKVTLAEWQETIDTNLTSAFYGAKCQIPALQQRGGGSLIFTSSFAGYTVTFPHMASYAASKAGLIGLVKALAVDLGPQGIRANALLPGAVRTEMHETFVTSEDDRDALRDRMALKRIAGPEEIARSALYLASDESAFTTGTAMLVDGGVSVHG